MICINDEKIDYDNNFNAFILKYKNFKQFSDDIDVLRGHKINIIIEIENDLVNIAAGFRLPVVKITGNAEEISKKLIEISDEMKGLSSLSDSN